MPLLAVEVPLRKGDPNSAGVDGRWHITLSGKHREGVFASVPERFPPLKPDRVYRLWASTQPATEVESALVVSDALWVLVPRTRKRWTEGLLVSPTATGVLTVRWAEEPEPEQPFTFFLDLLSVCRSSLEPSVNVRRIHQQLFPTGSR